ncbi:hypothetical protein FRC03_001479 [Tulasnella sp. 419]|nr:hypothetical protein FRC03_001479 [Tulasnella sp. 419]
MDYYASSTRGSGHEGRRLALPKRALCQVLHEEQWDNTGPEGPELVSVTAHAIDWGFWYDIKTETELLKKEKDWDDSSQEPLK